MGRYAVHSYGTSRPFDKPKSGRLAVKVSNHLGDESVESYLTR
jgi:adenine-specific DNA-methyltransferase